MISGFWQKLGFWSDKTIKSWGEKKDWIWFHAVSVGEINAVWALVLKLQKEKDSYPYMISTTTAAGYKHLKALTKNRDFLIFYFPFDLPWVINSLFNCARIKILIIAETEIWPNLLTECNRRNTPVILINARLSDKSFNNYKFFKFYFKNIVNNFTEVLSQSDTDTSKFKELGLEKSKLKTLGNIKFSYNSTVENNDNNADVIFGKSNEIKIIFASTHKGEEDIAVNVYKKLLEDFKNIRLIIAPRHIDRTNQISKLISQNGFIPVVKTGNNQIESNKEILILNTIGELIKYYKTSQITVLCGTFVKVGGHNIIEPIRAGSYTIIGPYNFKIKELTTLFKNEDAIVQVNNIPELECKLKEAISNKELREIKTRNGKRIIKRNQDVLQETAERIISYL